MTLKISDFLVDASCEKAQTLPIRAFHDQSVLDHELKTIFSHSWLCIPKAQLQAKPCSQGGNSTLLEILELRGNAVRYEFLGEAILLKRGFEPKGDPKLFAFSNICPHAFYPLLLEEVDERRSRQIQCGQHGLVVNWDGSYVSHPGFSQDHTHACKHLQLKEYAFESWFDFYFLCFGKAEHSFSSLTQLISKTMGPFPLDQLKWQPQSGQRRTIAGNWKQHAWNYMDFLHIQWIHKRPDGLHDAIEMGSYQTELWDQASLQWAFAKNPDDGFDPEMLPDRFKDPKNPQRRVFALWWLIFPNLTLNFYPWGLSVNIYNPIPNDPLHTDFHWYHYVLDNDKYALRNQKWLNSLVDIEDVMAMKKTSEMLDCKIEDETRGIFSPQLERGPHWFQHLVSKKMFAVN